MWRTLCTFFATLAFAVSLWGQSQIRIVRLSFVEGDVQLDRHDNQGPSAAFLNLPVVQDSVLSTGHDGYAEVEFEDQSTIRLTPDSELSFQELRRDDRGTTTSVCLQSGQAYFNLKHSKNDDFKLRLGSDYFVAEKRSHFRVSLTGENPALALFDGELQMQRTTGQFLTLKKNETLSLDGDDPSRYFLARNVAFGPDDDWDRQREKDLETLDQSTKLLQYRTYTDLNSYGAFQTVGAYGSIWRPYGVGYDWDPFQNGAWVSYPYAGTIWVSYSPWGWTPYRYGNWIFVPGIGWAWRPGAGINTWNTTPVIVNPPTTFHPPVRPVGPVHPVIIVGRPPRAFDGDRTWHHGPSQPIIAGAISRPVVTSAVTTSSSATATNQPPDQDRRHRDSYRPVSPAPQSTTTTQQTVLPSRPADTQPVRVERLPAAVPVNQPHPSSASPQFAPTPAQHYSPPPQSAAAPVQHYSPPPMQSSPSAAPPQRSAPARVDPK